MLGLKRPPPAFPLDRPRLLPLHQQQQQQQQQDDLKLIKRDAFSLYESTIRTLRSAGMARGGGEGGNRSISCCSCSRQASDLSSLNNRKLSVSNFSGKVVSVDLAISSHIVSSGNGSANVPTCSHCRRKACSMCCRQCARCDEDFCSVCSILDFQERYDRAFCFDCYAVVRASNSE